MRWDKYKIRVCLKIQNYFALHIMSANIKINRKSMLQNKKDLIICCKRDNIYIRYINKLIKPII